MNTLLDDDLNVTREIPQAQFDWLRYQVGFCESRPVLIPLYQGGHVVDYRESNDRVKVFHLTGWGATLQAAKDMAAASARHVPGLAGKGAAP